MLGIYKKATLSRLVRPGRLPGGGDTCLLQTGNDRLRHVNLDMPYKNIGNRKELWVNSDQSLTDYL